MDFGISWTPWTYKPSQISFKIGIAWKILSPVITDLLVSPSFPLNKFNVCHGSVVSPPGECSNDPCITTISLPVPILNLRKQGMNNLLFINEAKRLPSLVKRPVLGEGDHLVNILPHSAGPCSGGFNTSMLQELSGEATQQCTALVRGPVELGNTLAMPHSVYTTPIVNNGETVLKAGQIA